MLHLEPRENVVKDIGGKTVTQFDCCRERTFLERKWLWIIFYPCLLLLSSYAPAQTLSCLTSPSLWTLWRNDEACLLQSDQEKLNFFSFMSLQHVFKVNMSNHVYSLILVNQKKFSHGFLPIRFLWVIAFTTFVLSYSALTSIEFSSLPVMHNSPQHPNIVYLMNLDFR